MGFSSLSETLLPVHFSICASDWVAFRVAGWWLCVSFALSQTQGLFTTLRKVFLFLFYGIFRSLRRNISRQEMELKSVFSFKFLRAFLHLFFSLKRAYKSGLMAELNSAPARQTLCASAEEPSTRRSPLCLRWRCLQLWRGSSNKRK